ncbi:growth inhibitor [Leptolyngbya sp. PCC 7375]|nr:growth inhibitor [Leptolyngbya sp. PCC 7375]
MTYKFGDVVLVPFPFTNQVASKKRPAVIVSSDGYNQRHIDIVLMAITSQTSATAYADNVVIQDWKSAGLLKPSVIKPIIMTVEKELVLKQLVLQL